MKTFYVLYKKNEHPIAFHHCKTMQKWLSNYYTKKGYILDFDLRTNEILEMAECLYNENEINNQGFLVYRFDEEQDIELYNYLFCNKFNATDNEKEKFNNLIVSSNSNRVFTRKEN